MPRTVETDGFQADLASQRSPEQFLAPLSHAVSPQAPSGLAHGLVTAVQTRTRTMRSPDMPLGPAARGAPVWRTIMRFGAGRHPQPTVSRFTVAGAPEPPSLPAPSTMLEQIVEPESHPVRVVPVPPSAEVQQASLTVAPMTAAPAMVLPVVAQRTVSPAPNTEGPAADPDPPAVETLGVADE
ncbi:MAG TPA: hypothetical protein VIJ69_03555, partial [Actinomycetota bacterium]